MVSRTTIQLDI